MTNVKSKGATKELAIEAQKVRDDATRVRKSADSLVQSLKKLEGRFQREKEEAAAQLRGGTDHWVSKHKQQPLCMVQGG